MTHLSLITSRKVAFTVYDSRRKVLRCCKSMPATRSCDPDGRAGTRWYRASAARASLEDLAQGVRKETGAALRELQVDHGEAVRQLAALQDAHQRAQRSLQVGRPSPNRALGADVK